MKKGALMGGLLQFIIVFLAILIMFLGGLAFLLVSFVFLALGGLAEFIFMNRFYGGKKKLRKKRCVCK